MVLKRLTPNYIDFTSNFLLDYGLVLHACIYYPTDGADSITKDYLIIYTPCLTSRIIEEPLMEVFLKSLNVD